MHDHLFVLKHGKKLVRLSFTAVYQVTYQSEPKVGGGLTFRSGPSFARVWYKDQEVIPYSLDTWTVSLVSTW